MIERGLLPDFSAAAMAELARIQAAATDRHSDMRDLTGLLWASIDNDDSRDLDQLTVAESLADGRSGSWSRLRTWTHWSRRTPRWMVMLAQHDVGLYGRRDFPMLPEELSTDLTSLGEGQDRLAIVVEMVIAEDGASSVRPSFGRWSGTTRSSPITASPRGWRGRRPHLSGLIRLRPRCATPPPGPGRAAAQGDDTSREPES